MRRFTERLKDCDNLADVFELVKESVKKHLGLARAGLMLGLADLGMTNGRFVGAFFILGSNIIVVNKTVIRRIAQAETFSKELLNAYCFHVLLHEYLHSLGYLHEHEVKRLTYEICGATLGEEHLATEMSIHGIGSLLQNVTYPGPDYGLPRHSEIELIKGFDRSSTTYIT